MLFQFIIIGVIVLTALIVGWWLYRRVHAPSVPEKTVAVESFVPFLRLTAEDLIKLANAAYMEQLDTLIKESDVANRMPVFYQNYQELNQKNREAYFQNLLDVLRKDKKEYIDNLLNNRSDISTQEILLLILMKSGVSNKAIAKVLFITPDTLKKRKSRLKSKMQKNEQGDLKQEE